MSAYDTATETSTETEHATVVESPPRWKGPFTEYDRYGEPTGAEYVRCSGCGIELLGEHTDETPRVVAINGGIIEAGDEGEVLKDTESDGRPTTAVVARYSTRSRVGPATATGSTRRESNRTNY